MRTKPRITLSTVVPAIAFIANPPRHEIGELGVWFRARPVPPQRTQWYHFADASFFPRGWQRNINDQQMEVLAEAGACPEDIRHILAGNGRLQTALA